MWANCHRVIGSSLLALCVLVALAGIAAAAPVPVALWTMEEGTGTTTADATGNGHTGSLLGTPAVNWISANVAPVPTGSTAAIQFNNLASTDDGRIETNVDNYKGVTGTGSRTFSSWVNMNGTGASNGDQSFVSCGANAAGEKWTFRVQTTNGTHGAIRVEVNGGYVVGNTDIRDSDWHHVVATLADNGASTDVSQVRLYVDGRRQVLSAFDTQAISTTSGANVRLGDDFSNRPFQGLMDETAIYDSSLSAADIRVLATGSAQPLATLDYNARTYTGGGNWQDQVGLPVTTVAPDIDVSGASYGATGDGKNPMAFSFAGAKADFLNSFDFEQEFVGNATNDSASFEIWFRPDDLTGNEILWELGGSGDGSSLSLNGSNLQLVAKNQSTTSSVAVDLNDLVEDGLSEFTHAVSVIDLDNGLLSLFVNGQLSATSTFTGVDWSGTDGGALAGINGTAGGTGGALGDISGYARFAGDISVFRYYSDALTLDDAILLYVPEPSSMLLVLIGGLCLLLGRRYRSKN